MQESTITNALTIDVEDYFQVSAFAPYIARTEWETRECRVERNVQLILDMLDKHGVKATFFTLGWVAERYPWLVKDIARSGHEVASHGYAHQRASDQTPAAFLSDIKLAKVILEDLAGAEVKGYRAPSFSIGVDNQWAFDSLVEAGYRYSSSIYPIKHDHYGIPDAPRFMHDIRPGLVEIPATTIRAFDRNWPAGGGGYFRLMPYALSRKLINKVNHDDKASAIFYFHPWEVDPEQPRVAGINAKARFRHYLNLKRMEARLNRLLGDFKWGRMDDIFLNEQRVVI
ncbi:MAG TPA: XrtA system polysaccharide deacetylase [Rhodocyclaceae bacterium]|nr:XrtA system polysaccharide deacetylase [Rhodocyclaceae bacterium]